MLHGEAAIAVRPKEANHEAGETEPACEQANNAGQETNDESHKWKHLVQIRARRYQLQN